jgi:predicted nucleic acid-binding protein
MIRALADTSVLLAAFAGPEGSPADDVLAAQRAGEFELVTSPRLVAELSGVLARPAFAAQSAGGRAEKYVSQLAEDALFAADVYDPPRATADRNHDFLIAVARRAGVPYVITEDRDFGGAYVRELQLLTPLEFVTALRRARAA